MASSLSVGLSFTISPMMDARQFVAIIKHSGVDWSVKSTLEELSRIAPPPPPPKANESPIQQSISGLILSSRVRKYTRAQWFQQLSANDRQIVAELLRECTEKAISSVFAIIDGVAGEVPGVFEIAEIDGDERKVINPQNSEMLHDLFSDICEVEQVRE